MMDMSKPKLFKNHSQENQLKNPQLKIIMILPFMIETQMKDQTKLLNHQFIMEKKKLKKEDDKKY